ncbi:MAG: electron transfer flavoprotein subunit beta/FixA family protein [Thermodesulfobacteriota bacterium]
MNILVCIKQVLDSGASVRIEEESGKVIAEGSYWMNHADEFAVEEALVIKDACPGTVVDVITVGPDRAAQVLERAMGMGADTGVHVRVLDEAPLSPWQVAAWIGSCARDRGYDLILAGVMAEDDMQGQVGPLLAEYLRIPCATSVICQTIDEKRDSVYVEREMESGRRDCLELDLPALLTVQTGMNQPRYPTLSNLMRAKAQKATVIAGSALPPVEARETVLGIHYPQQSRAGVCLKGDPREKAVQLLEILQQQGLMRGQR